MVALSKAIKILTGLIPVVVQTIHDVEAKIAAAKAPGSDGGAKLTPLEITKIVAAEIGPVVEALINAIVAAVS